ncbi:MAG TPA: hypothetical protein VN750_18730, partial [Steroidobacteraceae bacterium]|nr:hypothetical protein [Steroidobacteraceae bacterium]
MRRISLAGRVALALTLVAVIAAAVAVLAGRWLLSPLGSAAAAVLVAGLVALWLARFLTRPWSRVLHAVR